MSHRERVYSVLSGEQPDQPVADLGGRVASLNTSAYLNLKNHLGYDSDLSGETVTSLNTIGELDERIYTRFDIPIRRIFLNPATTYEKTVAPDGTFKDEWHVLYKPMGEYNERVGHPLANARLEDLETFPWPDPDDLGRVRGLAEKAQRLYNETDYALAAGHISAGIFQDCWNLRGMEQFMLDMTLDHEFAEALLEKITEIHIGMWNHFLDAVGDFVDIVETADDLAGQTSLLISPEMYRDLIKPRHAALNEAIRAKTNAKILYHSCGAVMPLIDDLIEIGVEILNPIQPLPGIMDPEILKKRYGKKLVFHGGLDVQTLLPTGTPAQVCQHVRRYFEVLGADRYIMAPANSVQPDTPPENIVAAYDALQETKVWIRVNSTVR
ncbi:MAG: hypothetical protein KJ638_11715 [Chloroflexi bacterium]|nr:hypothetical protein [Chloroflexota bacterium]